MGFPAYKTLAAGALVLMVQGAPSYAAEPVIDVKSLAEAKKQLTVLKDQARTLTDQLDVLRQAREGIDGTLKSIGEVTSISLPSLNFNKISGQIMSDQACLVPDFNKLMPDVSFEDVDIRSLCARSDAYRNGLVAKSKDIQALPWEAKRAAQAAINAARINTIADAAFKGLAQADVAHDNAVETLKAAQEYKSEGRKAKTVNDRLQVLIEINTALLQSQSQTNQLLAQLLKVSSSTTIAQGVPVESELGKTDMKKGGSS